MSTVGVPRVLHHEHAESQGYTALVIELCGPSLDHLRERCGGKFTIKTVCFIARQMVSLSDQLRDIRYRVRNSVTDHAVALHTRQVLCTQLACAWQPTSWSSRWWFGDKEPDTSRWCVHRFSGLLLFITIMLCRIWSSEDVFRRYFRVRC
jgi:hypothetical protein